MGQNTSAPQERSTDRLEGKPETETRGVAHQQQPVVYPEAEGAATKWTEPAVREGEKTSEPATIESENVTGGGEAISKEGQSTADSSLTTGGDVGGSVSTAGTNFSIPLSTHAEKEEGPSGSRFEEGTAANFVVDSNWSDEKGLGLKRGRESLDDVLLGEQATNDGTELLSTQTDPSSVAAKEGLEMLAKTREHWEPPPRPNIKSGPGLFELCCKPRANE